MTHDKSTVKRGVTAHMATAAKGQPARGRKPAPWVRKEGETDEAFAQRVVTQDRDRLRKNGGAVVVLLQELKEEVAGLRLIIGEMVADAATAVAAEDQASERPEADRASGPTVVDVARFTGVVVSGLPLRIFRHVAGREPDAAEGFSLEDGWNAAARLFPQHAAHWFASALAAYFKEHPDGTAMLWVRQMHEQFEIPVRHDWPEWLT